MTNTGSVAGETVVQVYGRIRHCSHIRPDKRLLAWQRIALQPGECREVTFPITPDMLRMYDAQGKAIVPKGVCDIAVGESSDVPYTLDIQF